MTVINSRPANNPTSLSGFLRGCRRWLLRQPSRRLRLCESLALGEKRFVAVVQFEKLRYLVGGTGSSITMLSQLPDSTELADGTEDSPAGKGLSCVS
jgi:flagellar biogenesis protein FliO